MLGSDDSSVVGPKIHGLLEEVLSGSVRSKAIQRETIWPKLSDRFSVGSSKKETQETQVLALAADTTRACHNSSFAALPFLDVRKTSLQLSLQGLESA